MPIADTHPLSGIMVYLSESEQKIFVRTCNSGGEPDGYPLFEKVVGLRINNGSLTIGDGVSISNPIPLVNDIPLGPEQTQACFVHVIDESTNETTALELFGTIDDRDECELVGIGKPRRAYRIDITTTDITMEIDNLNNLKVRYDGNSSNGVQHVITTNIEPVN